MLFSITACIFLLYTASISIVNIFSNASSVILFLFKMYSLVILNDSNISSSVSMSVASGLSVLFICSFHHNVISQ